MIIDTKSRSPINFVINKMQQEGTNNKIWCLITFLRVRYTRGVIQTASKAPPSSVNFIFAKILLLAVIKYLLKIARSQWGLVRLYTMSDFCLRMFARCDE